MRVYCLIKRGIWSFFVFNLIRYWWSVFCVYGFVTLTHCFSSAGAALLTVFSAHVPLTWDPKAFSCLLLLISLSNTQMHIWDQSRLICNFSLSIDSSVIKGPHSDFCRWNVLLAKETSEVYNMVVIMWLPLQKPHTRCISLLECCSAITLAFPVRSFARWNVSG